MNKINCTLLVDNEEDVNFVNEKLVKRLDVTNEVKSVLNGYEALNFISKYYKEHNACPELIFLDLHMPIMDGYEFLSAFQDLKFSNKIKVVIVLLSETSTLDAISKANYPGVREFIGKPLTEEKIQKIAEKHFKK